MDTFGIFLARAFSRSSSLGNLPERRKIELSYNEKLGIPVIPFLRTRPEPEPFPGFFAPLEMFDILDDYLVFQKPELEARSSLDRYHGLPKTTRTEKILAEFYRILRVYHIICTYQEGRISEKTETGQIEIDLPEKDVVYDMHYFPEALEVLCAGIVYYLSSLKRPDPPAYVDAMLSAYYRDVVASISFFCDEVGNLYQFHSDFLMNRHLRLLGGNAEFKIEGDFMIFQLEEMLKDPSRYPIDFYFQVYRKLHVLPVEALTDGKLPITELPRWLVKGAHHD